MRQQQLLKAQAIQHSAAPIPQGCVRPPVDVRVFMRERRRVVLGLLSQRRIGWRFDCFFWCLKRLDFGIQL
jgi:hypothetical protein